MNLHLIRDMPEGLTRRARTFIGAHGIKVDSPRVDEYREGWLGIGIPGAEIDRVAAYREKWGGLVLPPSPEYDGGPKLLSPDTPDNSLGEGWWFEAGMQRTAVPYSFMIGPAGEFGIHSDRWTPLHASIEGWVESLALAHHASTSAPQITKVTGDAVAGLSLDGYEPMPEAMGLADTWWRGTDSLIAIYTGEAECLAAPKYRTAYIYSGLDEWALRG
ncbi:MULTISPECIES: hypothetical protein [unclassified Streptomyces]|uniref:hypothetical protein n=1 Tax=unclassified Streptomyces TaxID=2593676 RepID=UPI00342762C9